MTSGDQSRDRAVTSTFLAAALRRLRCIRLDEVLVLQGTPIIGLAFAAGHVSPALLLPAALSLLASMLLVAHIFVVNDTAGWETDWRDPARRDRSMAARGVTRAEMRLFAIRLLIYAVALSLVLGPLSLLFCCALAALGFAYSGPGFFWKNVPIANSTLHLLGGALHFLFGYAALAPPDLRGFAMSLFFGLVFMAGHLMHEVRDHAVDSANEIDTNAVIFGRQRTFVAGLACFSAGLLLVAVLAWAQWVPALLLVVSAMLPLHLVLGLVVLRTGLSSRWLLSYQKFYRVEFALIGAFFIAIVPHW